MDVTQLKTLQDWVGRAASCASCRASPTSLVLGGKTKEYQAEIDLNKMVSLRR